MMNIFYEKINVFSCYLFLQKTQLQMFGRIPNMSLVSNQVNIYFFKVNFRNTGKRGKMYSKITIKTPERRHWRIEQLIVSWVS